MTPQPLATLALTLALAITPLSIRAECYSEQAGAITGMGVGAHVGQRVGAQTGVWIGGLLCTAGLLASPLSGGVTAVIGCTSLITATTVASGFIGRVGGGILGGAAGERLGRQLCD